MNDYNPGPGWREAEESEAFPAGTRVVREHIIGQRGYERVWVREEPVPPLPTEPGYYVDVDGCAWRLDENGEWDDTFGNPTSPGSTDPSLPLERYEPRHETAKAVLDRVTEEMVDLPFARLRVPDIAREFGVSS